MNDCFRPCSDDTLFSIVLQLLSFLVHANPQLVNLSLVNLLPFTVQSSPYRSRFTALKSGPDGRGYLKVLAGISRASQEEVGNWSFRRLARD